MAVVKVDPQTLKPGTVVRFRNSTCVTLAYRKEDGSGWWNVDGSGLADRVWNEGDWSVAYEPTITEELAVALINVCRVSFGEAWRSRAGGVAASAALAALSRYETGA